MENDLFTIEDVQDTLAQEVQREKVKVEQGEYTCEIKAPLPDVRRDSKGHNKLLLPLEIMGNDRFDGQWLFEAIYMNNQHDDAGKVKDGISKRKVARLAGAVGLTKLSSLSELEGQYVKVEYGPNKNGYLEIREVASFGDVAVGGGGAPASPVAPPPASPPPSIPLPAPAGVLDIPF
jgi:hypothetical protein